MASLSHFPSLAAELPGREGRSWRTVVPSPAAGLKQGAQVEQRVGVKPLNGWADAIHTHFQLEHRQYAWSVRKAN